MKQDRQEEASINPAQIDEIVQALVSKHGSEQRERIETGVKQVAGHWRAKDGSFGDLKAFCLEHFITDSKALSQLFTRCQDNIEQISGHLHEVSRFLREPTDLDRGPVLPVDKMFAGYDLRSHVTEDLFKAKIAFIVLLNFKEYTLEEKIELGPSWSREQWAQARAAGQFTSRVPPEVRQEITEAFVAADDYISNYNIFMHHLLDPDGTRLFRPGLKLITHWGLRDELKAHYGSDEGLPKQRMIQAVMEKVVTQEIPRAVIDNPHMDWIVESGVVKKTEAKDFEASDYADKTDIPVCASRESDTRYEHLLKTFRAVKLADPYYPKTPTYVERKFKISREIPEEQVVELLTSVLAAPVIRDIGALIAQRLGRDLEPFDIWYDGFSARGSRGEEELDAIVRQKYPNVEAVQNDLPKILERLGFDTETAEFLSAKIVVDPSRGAGHASGAERREDKAHLRTRIPADGMNYKGYNIAIHELGHNVEQVFSLNRIDHYLLNGVPNTAFTEGFAFAFQGNDIKLLGLATEDPNLKHLKVLDTIWSTFEISGVALVDIGIWRWMYDHPEATPEEVRKAMIQIARDVWNQFFAPVFGIEDQILLAIYSHIIDAGMYIPDYPIGFLIQFQMEDYFAKNGLAKEMERMCRLGSITPDAWMQAAVGGPISAAPLTRAAEQALASLGKE
ncbi:MAG: hypothetical protein GY854_28560 [Deltaproteobacteria bacterium]|nr:hypothetical protein [Deltaproteobacteria bacterium]